MAKHCINVKSPEFKQLVEESKINPLALAAKISLWQDANNTDEFPSVDEIRGFGGTSVSIKPEISELFESNPKLANLVYSYVRDNNPLYTEQGLIDKYGEEGIEIFKTLKSTEWNLGPERYKVSSLSTDNVQSLLRFRKEHDTIVKELEENLHLLFEDIINRKHSNIMLENVLEEFGEAAYETLKDKLDDRKIKKGISPYGEEKFLKNKLSSLLTFLEEFGFPSLEFNSLLKSSIEFTKSSEKGSFNESLDKLFNLLESSKKFNASTYYMNKLNTEEGITPQQKQEAQAKFQEYINITGSQDIRGFREYLKPILQHPNNIDDLPFQKQSASNVNQPFDKELHKKIENKLKKLYPEIKLEYNNNPSWVKDNNVFNQKSQLDNEVNYRLKAVNILLSDRAKQVFAKGEKNGWDLNKILTELQIPKEQKTLLLKLNVTNREQLAVELTSKYGFSIETNIAKAVSNELQRYNDEDWNFDYFDYNKETYFRSADFDINEKGEYVHTYRYKKGTSYSDSERISEEDWEAAYTNAGINVEQNTKAHINLSARDTKNSAKYLNNPDWEYNEVQINTPLIEPSIKGHTAPFDNINGIGWTRLWKNKKTNVVEIQEIQSDLFQKGRGESILATKLEERNEEYSDFLGASTSQISTVENVEANQFLQLLNKDSNWVTFFIKSIIQDSAKKGYKKVLFPKGETAAKIEGHQTIADELESLNRQISREKEKLIGYDKIINEPLTEMEDLFGKPELIKAKRHKETAELYIKELEQRKSELKSQGIEKLKPIEAFYEIKIGNILEKQFSKDNVKTITDEFGNQWREITINQARDLQDILLQKNEADRIIGQANIKALSILIDAVNQRQDTLPHEYAHHYIAWNRNSPIVKEAIKKWGSEEALVQSIGEQVVKQKGEAYNWWNNFVKWIMNQFNSLSKLQKEELTQILTDAFLTRQDLDSKQDIQGFKEFVQGKQFQKQESVSTIQSKKNREVIPVTERTDLYKSFNLLNSKGKLPGYSTVTPALKARINKLNKDINNYEFDIRRTATDEKYRVFILRPIDTSSKTSFRKPEQFADESGMLFAEDLEQTAISNQALEDNNSELPRLTIKKRQEAVDYIDNQLLQMIDKIGIKHNGYETLKEKLDIDAYGFVKLLEGGAEIKFGPTRDRFTVSEEVGHIYFEMLRGTPFEQRFLNALSENDHYIKVLKKEGTLQEYKDFYKNNTEAIKREVAGKVLGKVLGNRAESMQNQPTGLRALLRRIKDFLQRMIDKLPYNRIAAKIDYLANEIADKAFDNRMEDIGGFVSNIKPVESKILPRVRKNIESRNDLLQTTLASVITRQKYYDSVNKPEIAQKYRDREKVIVEKLNDNKSLEGITYYLDTLVEDQADFKSKLDKTIETINGKEHFEKDYVLRNTGSLRRMKMSIDANLITLENIVNELSEEVRHKPDSKEILTPVIELATKLANDFQEAERTYYDLGGIFISEFFKPLLGDRNSQDKLDSINLNKPENKKLKFLNLEEELKYSEGDINLVSRWMNALADTDSNILKLIDLAAKQQRIKGNRQSLKLQKDLLDAQEALNKAGVKSTAFAAETHKGKHTGNFVTEYDWSDYNEASGTFYSNINKEIQEKFETDNYTDFIKNANELSEKYGKEYSDYRYTVKRKIRTFYTSYRLSQAEVQEIIKDKSPQWIAQNTKIDGSGNIYIPRKKSKQYQEIQKNPAKKAYYDVALKIKYDSDMLLPEKSRDYQALPQIMKDWVEKGKDIVERGDMESAKNLASEVKYLFQLPEDVDDRGVKYVLSNDASQPIKFLPIYYVKKLKNPSEVSLDITGSLAIFAQMANDYAGMSEIIDAVEIARDLVDVRKVYQVDEQGRPVVSSVKGNWINFTKKMTSPRRASFESDRLNDALNMIFYGELKKDEGTLGVLLDSFTAYSAITSLGFNLFAGLANINTALSMERIEGVAGEFFSSKSLLKGDKRYAANLPQIIEGIGSLDSKGRFTGKVAKINLWAEDKEIMQDWNNRAKGLNADRKNFFSRMFSMSNIFFINNAGEHYVQTRTSLALADNYRYDTKAEKFVWKSEFYNIKNKLDLQRRQEIKKIEKPTKAQIQEINKKYKELTKKETDKLDKVWDKMTDYYDAHVVNGRRLELAKGFKFNIEDHQRFILRTNALNKEFHGIYNDIDKSAAQQYALFRFVWQFRKWMVPFWNRRYGKSQWSYEKDAYQEGYYRTVQNFFVNLYNELKAGEVSLRKNWHLLSKEEKANFYKVMAEVGHLLAFMVLANVLTRLSGDNDDDWALQMAAYQANRAITEVGSMTFPWIFEEGIRMIDRPAAGISHIKNLNTLAAPWDWMDEIERGRFEGYTKFERMVIKGTPVLGQVKSWGYPEEKMVFYIQK